MEAIRSLLDQHPDLRTKIRIQLIGSLHDNDRAFLNRGGLAANVEISGYISHRRAIEALCQADLLFLCLTSVRDRKLNEWVPQKTYEYLASGKPILAPLPEGDAKDLVTKAGTGIACSPNNTEEMRNTILRIYQAHADGEIPSSANEAFIAQFERKNLTARLASLFDQLIEG
jgi:glycosyltransferase involved in cell wall biosynthesis